MASRVRVVAVSDTHNSPPRPEDVSPGDVLIHAGDFSMGGSADEVKAFDDWLGKLPHRYKVVICGNHEYTFDPHLPSRSRPRIRSHKEPPVDAVERAAQLKSLIKNALYLEDSGTTLRFDDGRELVVWGSPATPEFMNWGFNYSNAELQEKWAKIPATTQILITHGPPHKILDLTTRSQPVGCRALLARIAELKRLRMHVFGHIHESHGCRLISRAGMRTLLENSAEETLAWSSGTGGRESFLSLRKSDKEGEEMDEVAFVNASVMSVRYRPVQSAVVVDVFL